MSSRRRKAAARRKKKSPDSPMPGESHFLVVGRLHRAHGLKGELVMSVLTDFPERLVPGLLVYVGEEHVPHTLLSLRQHNTGRLVTLEGYTSREQAGEIRNQYLYVRADDRPPLPEGEYYHHQLIGLRVVTDEGRELGILAEILETGANEVYIVRREGAKDVLLPGIDEVILDLDLEKGEILVHLLEGLAE